MLESVSAYRGTDVHWVRSQGEILKLLEKHEAKDVRFTNISHESAEQGGLVMKPGTFALMIEFHRLITFENGVSGKVPVRILIPGVGESDRSRNQAYRLIFWYLKSKFEAVETGLVDFEQEFLPHLMIKDRSGFVGTIWQLLRKPYEAMLGQGDGDFLKVLPSPRQPEEEQSEENEVP